MTQPLPLVDAGGASVEVVGGKARALGQLMRLGFDVPPGWSVPPGGSFDGISGSEDVKATLFAVRSSGAAEDGHEESLAGRFTSVLNVELESIPGAIAKVRADAMEKDGVSIPVVVQQMIQPLCAGVAFTADPVTGDRDQTIVTATAGLADRLVSGDVAGDEWVVNGTKAKARRQPDGVLRRRVALKVARLAERIADALGGPQDVEWAWDGKTVWVVQARPITSLPPDVDWTPPHPGVFHRSLRFGEWLPEPITPLCESWLLTHMERQVHEYLRELIGQVAHEPHHVVVNGWYFYSVNWLPAPGVAFWRNFFSIVPRLPKNWRNAAGMFPQTIRFASDRFEDQWRNELLPEYEDLVADAGRQVDHLEIPELVKLVDSLADAAGRYFGSIAVVAGSAYKFEAQLAQFWNTHLREELDTSHMVLLQGFDQSEALSRTPRLESLDWSRPPLPPGPPPQGVDRIRSERVALEGQARSLLSASPRKLARFNRLLADAQHHAPVREEQISQLGIAWPVMRRAILRIGAALVESSVLQSEDHVFLLSKQEVVQRLDNATSAQDLVEDRRRTLHLASKLTPPLTVGRVPLIVKILFSMSGKIQGAQHDPNALLHGTPASPGRATGRVRIIHNASQFASLQEGEILVAPITAPAWTDLFTKAAGVITDVGSALAHASIIAREYGIPAVVGCGDATARLKDGQTVTVDGSTGNVVLVDRRSHVEKVLAPGS